MLYMVVEHFKGGDAVPIYRRFRERGPMAPEGLGYVWRWVDDKLAPCYQVMETNDRRLPDIVLEITASVTICQVRN